MQRSFLEYFNMDLLHILKTAILKNYYVYGIYNERYIAAKKVFNKKDFMHDFLLIGCDENKFVSVGYVADGRFTRFDISNSDMLSSIHGLSGTEMNLHMISYNAGIRPAPNYERMIDKLRQYLSTIDKRIKALHYLTLLG